MYLKKNEEKYRVKHYFSISQMNCNIHISRTFEIEEMVALPMQSLAKQ